MWSATLPAGTNSPLAIAGDRLVTAAGLPQSPSQEPALVVFQLNGVPGNASVAAGWQSEPGWEPGPVGEPVGSRQPVIHVGSYRT